MADAAAAYALLAELLARHRAEPCAHGVELTPYELKVFSQNGEDGVIAELLRRIEPQDPWFVEFGAGDGSEGNCAFLAEVLGWSGALIEADEAAAASLAARYAARPQVRTAREAVTPGNVERVFAALEVPPRPAVLSIDVDGPDYWIWEALSAYRPAIVVIEYNAALDPGRRLVQPPDHDAPWDGTDFFGASIAALRALGAAKGYRLVYTELAGVNAFFVREDAGGSFPEPDAVPLRGPNYFLRGGGHRPSGRDGDYVEVDP